MENCKQKKEKDYIKVQFPEGEKSLLILFTYSSEEYKKNYVFCLDEKSKEYFAFQVVDDSKLHQISDEKEMDYLDGVLEEFLEENGCGEKCCCNHHGDHECCDGKCDEDHECDCHGDHDENCSCKDGQCDCHNHK